MENPIWGAYPYFWKHPKNLDMFYISTWLGGTQANLLCRFLVPIPEKSSKTSKIKTPQKKKVHTCCLKAQFLEEKNETSKKNPIFMGISRREFSPHPAIVEKPLWPLETLLASLAPAVQNLGKNRQRLVA